MYVFLVVKKYKNLFVIVSLFDLQMNLLNLIVLILDCVQQCLTGGNPLSAELFVTYCQ